LFQDFERLDAATSVEGTGLGLAIAARIVKLMGGIIHYDPNPDGGSVFWFELPMANLQSPLLHDPVKGTSPSSGQHVLLVDDIKINRDIVGSFLDAAGRTVTLAESGRESVRLAAEKQFDVILMDVRMPEMDGLEATRHIRALPSPHGQVPILALTAYTFPDQVTQCRDAGMDGHVPKPVDYETLMHAIDAVVAQHVPQEALSSTACRPTREGTPSMTLGCSPAVQAQPTNLPSNLSPAPGPELIP
jgi:CheY-like chemotaxis protein